MAPDKGLIPFNIEQATFSYLAPLEAPVFEVLRTGGQLYASIYKALRHYQLKLTDLKVEPTVNPGDAQVTCHILGFDVLVRYRLDRVEVWCESPEMLDEKGLRELVERVISVVRDVAERPVIATHTFSVGVHGKLAQGSIEAMLRSYVSAGPAGTPAFHPAGVSFAYERPGGEGEASVVLERSASVRDGAFLRMVSVHPGRLAEKDAFDRAWRFFDETADRLGLEVAWGQ